MYRNKNRQRLRRVGLIFDTIDVLLGIAILVTGLLIFTDVSGNVRLFPALFGMAGAMNLIMGLKYIIQKARLKGFSMVLTALILAVISVISYIGTWN